jgi:hypothetical protein
MILIIGRSGSGKDFLARELAKNGLSQVKSYTTRPPRYEGEDTHIFISAEEASRTEGKIATTVINGYEYFATAGADERKRCLHHRSERHRRALTELS